MNTLNKKILLQAAAALIMASAAGATDYRGLAASLAEAARANGINRLAIASFKTVGGDESEARFAREKTGAVLSAVKGLEVLDQEALDSYKGSGARKKLPAKERPQAFLSGTLFQAGEETTLIVSLIDARSGRVVKTAEIESYTRFSGLPPVPDINWGQPPVTAAVRDDFRDAPADSGFNCSAAFSQMGKINAAAVDLKARYWARKLKEPGFVHGSLTRNPGSEIRDRGVRQQFYELLTAYHERESAPPLAAAQAAKLEEFMGRESDVIDRCGSR